MNALLGLWLLISTFLWPHTPASHQNGWIVGLLMLATAIASIFVSAIRWVNTILAIWLFISTLTIRQYSPATSWHNVIIAIIVFALSLVPSVDQRRSPTHQGT